MNTESTKNIDTNEQINNINTMESEEINMNNAESKVIVGVQVVNTDNKLTEAVLNLDGVEIRIPYTKVTEKGGAKLIRNSFINAGYPVNDKTIEETYKAISKTGIEHVYSRVSASPDRVLLNREYKENKAQEDKIRTYSGGKLIQSGEFKSQKPMIKKLLNNNVGSVALSATITGMVNRVLELEDSQQIINIVGQSSSGKTSLSRGLQSVFGNNKDYMVADNTDLGLSKLLADNDFLPLYADDFLVRYMSDKKSSAVLALRKLIMTLSAGRTKSTARKDSIEFAGAFIMTSENSITDMLVSESSNIIGDAYRFIEVPMDKSLFKSATDVKRYTSIMKANAGFLGDMVAEYLMTNKKEVQAKYDELYHQISDSLDKNKIADNIQPTRCANRVASLAISYYITSQAVGVYDESRQEEFINYLIDMEIAQLSKYKVVSLDDKFRQSISADYKSLDKILGKDFKPVAYTGEKRVAVDDNFIDYDVNGSAVVLRMSKSTLKEYLKKKKFDERNVVDVLRSNRESVNAKIVAAPEGRSTRLDKKCTDLGKRMIVLEFELAA